MAVPPADAQGRPDGFIIRRWKWEWSKNVPFSEGKLGTRHVKGTFTESSSAFLHTPTPSSFFPFESLSHRLLLDHLRGSQSGQQNVCGESYCKIDLTENFHHKHSIVLTSCPWVSEDAPSQTDVQCQECPSQNQRKLTENIRFFSVLCLQPELKRNKYYGISQNNLPVTFQRNDAMMFPFLSFFLEMMEQVFPHYPEGRFFERNNNEFFTFN